ncbi:MAG: M1 family metallopeptidase [Bacteroidia bacterium]|nr:M1 family metallopeptidase [Bacteroidia bacterium]MBT8276490.1 M1 family metallopeptidase [Bacteroidia bacterium]NNF32039.1 M1 family metallopeptidase [Flavobacteriaceae bacterium]NNK53441.1 M1 family metallopeptidase [Flavobacteriaceae bacterium]NNM09828.1 M1 family metallopeptidase [Flavobacteriaceae bacterium]
MKLLKYLFLGLIFIATGSTYAQDTNEDKEERKPGHYNENRFKQLYEEFSTPNVYRTASGAPGPQYYQQQADYKMDITLDDKNARLYGKETITYTNNSPDILEYLWIQLDQNVRAADSKSPLIESSGAAPADMAGRFVGQYMGAPFDGGFKIQEVKDGNGKDLPNLINQTMMRVEMPKDLKPGEKFSFSIKWWYNIPEHTIDRARSGYETFEDGNRGYVIAQFYPRMAVYNDVEGWQNSQFWGRDEFALPFGNFDVNITVPADHTLDATGKLLNRKEVFSKTMMQRYAKAKKEYTTPVQIVTEEEAEVASKGFATATKTWKFRAENVRDYGIATSRRYMWDMMAVKVGSREVMAVSVYPPEGNPLWSDWSTKVVASTLKSYSRMTFDYPYHKAISVHAKNQGMEYPMICWNYGRPDKDGNYSERTKYGMMSVIIHEVGHNYFPMIVNSDERQWTWMDEGLTTFVQYIAEQDFGEAYPSAIAPNKKYPSRRGPAKNIVDYMSGDQDYLAPIMTKGLNTYNFGANAYSKPATGLNILRETIMGRELFDYAFKTYAQRWMFKHPTPEDFFRTMEDASAVDLDWFWRSWFYTTDYTDIGVKEVKKFYVTSKMNKEVREMIARRGMTESDLPPLVYLVEEGSEDFEESMRTATLDDVTTLNEYIMDNIPESERANLKKPRYFYEVTFEKPGGIPMPIIAEYTYSDGSTERVTYPPQIWRKNDESVGKVVASDKEITKIMVDPDEETADIDTSNNSWPKRKKLGEFDTFKNKVKGQ